MIKDKDKLFEFEKEFLKNEKLDINKSFEIYENMYRYSVEMGILPLKNKLEGIEVDIKIAKVLNSV